MAAQARSGGDGEAGDPHRGPGAAHDPDPDPDLDPGTGTRRGADTEPDYRFTLANERTFLAWIRTALALIAGAVAVLHLVPLAWEDWAKLTIGFALTVLAVVITAYAPLRWLRVQRAMRRDRPLPLSALPLVTALGVALVCAVVLVGNLV